MFGIAFLLTASVVSQSSHDPAGSAQDPITAYASFDLDGDGREEIASLRLLVSEGSGPLILALVEERLLAPQDNAPNLLPDLQQWALDLALEGHHAQVIGIQLGAQERHQDGLTLLAIRELLRGIAQQQNLVGAVLVGHFPDALIVRTCNWRKRGDIQVNGHDFKNTPYLRRVPEIVADRADIVLADLDGSWSSVYVQENTALETVVAVFPEGVPLQGGVASAVEVGSLSFVDFFHLKDGSARLEQDFLHLEDAVGNAECSPEDFARSNVIARPELLISRIDARGVALELNPELGLLDEHGMPRAVLFDKGKLPNWRTLWQTSPVLERQLLHAYFQRNHVYRRGLGKIAWRPASIAFDLGSGYRTMMRAADDWQGVDPLQDNLSGRTTLNDFLIWMARPAVLRTVRAHSDPWGSVFAKPNVDRLNQQLGQVWIWSPEGSQLIPSATAACQNGKLDWYLLHAMWRSDLQASEPSFYHHTGCNGISPPGARELAYDHPNYGLRQGGEALLLFGNGLALIGRAKVFYDEPKGFVETLRARKSFGAAWARYFELESQAEDWADVGGDIGRKRSYFWSVLGDWTLRLQSQKEA